MDYRKAYGLPERYFLSLGRMVEKKNLSTLVEAYARYAQGVAVAGKGLKVKGDDGEKQGDMPGGAASPPQAKDSEVVTSHQSLATRYSLPALVFVGSGELEVALREQARGLGLRVIDRTGWKANGREEAQESASLKAEKLKYGKTETTDGEDPHTGGQAAAATKTRDSLPATRDEENCGTVFFYGFRQIEENPVFYALAEAFVLPSLKEEWGLVVNEAMAAGLPVIVSRTAGCAEDLVPKAAASGSVEHGAGPPARRPYGSERSMESGENAGALNPQLSTLNSLEERSNGFVFDPKSSDALATALARVAVAGEKLKVKGRKQGAGSGEQGVTETADGEDAAATLLAEMGRRSREIVATFSCENFARQALRAAVVFAV